MRDKTDESRWTDEDEDLEPYYDGFCHDCETEWERMEGQNCCPECGSDKCDLYECDDED